MYITAVRHGQTTGNIGKIVESRVGGVLTQKGTQQAIALGETLKSEQFDHVYCSDLQRCQDTARYILTHHPDSAPELRQELRELDKGIYNGRTWAELPEYIHSTTYITGRFEQGESWMDVAVRAAVVLNEAYAAGHEHILIVTHDGVLKVIQALLTAQPLQQAIQIHYENAQAQHWDMTDLVSADTVH